MCTYDIYSGTPAKEIIISFTRLEAAVHREKNKFYGDGWEVRLTLMPDSIHRSIIIPRTIIEFSGDRKKCEALIVSYRRAFMRGGA